MRKANLIILLAVVLILLVSCAENTGVQTTRLEALKAQYDAVGVEHNKQLDIMLDVYREQRTVNDMAVCKQLADQYFSEDIKGSIAENINRLIGDTRRFAKPTVNEDVVDILADSLDIVSNYHEIFDSMAVILDEQNEVQNKVTKLEALYLYVDESVENEDDKLSVMNGLSTTIHSLAYWNENSEQWQQTLDGTLQKPTLGIAGAIGIIDGAGAVIGTLEGIRDTYKGQEGRGRIILGRAIGESAKTSVYAVLGLVLL